MSRFSAMLRRPWDASHVLALAALVAPPLAIWAPLGLAPLFIVVSLAILAMEWHNRVWGGFPRPLLIPLAAICIWATVTSLWAIDPARSAFSAIQLTVNTTGGIILVNAARRLDCTGIERIGSAILVGLVLGAVAFVLGLVSFRRFDLLRHSLADGNFVAWRVAIQTFNRGSLVTIMMALPALAFLFQRNSSAKRMGGLGLAMATIGLSAKALAAKVVLSIAVASPILFRRPSRQLGLALGTALATLVGIIPLAAISLPPPQESTGWVWLPYSSHHRLTIWGFAAKRIVERPVLGWGMDSSRAMPGGEDEVTVFMEIPRGSGNLVEIPEQKMPLHPHNAVLQWWLELGGVGAALFATLLFHLGRLAVSHGPATRSVCAGSLLTGGVMVSVVSFGFWQSWWQCTMWLLAAWFVALAPRPQPLPPTIADNP